MAKEKTIFVCTACDAQFPKWQGQCTECGKWNTLVEEKQMTAPKNSRIAEKISAPSAFFSAPKKSENSNSQRISSGISEADRVLGGGFFADSLVLLTGDPGIGKSTLALQLAVGVAKNMPEKSVCIVSGEESHSQISNRIFRLFEKIPDNIKILSESIIERALQQLSSEDVGFIVLDSVQTLASLDIPSLAGSMTQTVAVTEKMMTFCKTGGIPCLLIGHVTKNGEMAGPQTLAHLVDATLHLEGDRFHEYRLLRSSKNRFGSVFEVGVFTMSGEGLEEVKNPSEQFLSGKLKNATGSVIFPTVEGTRPFLVEVQALSKYTQFGYPKRSASGFDVNRLGILLAVLARHTGLKLDNEDVFVNVVGGLKLKEPAADLAVIAAIVSAKKKIPVPEKILFCGEVGLSGEIRTVSHLEKRLKEGKNLGFEKMVISAHSKISKEMEGEMEMLRCENVGEMVGKIF